MSLIQRFFCQLLDYLWFWSLGLICLDLLSFDLGYAIGFTLFLPLFFIPIEAVCLTLFRTTLGKILFGMRYHIKLSLKEAFRVSTKRGLWTLPLFIPGVNLFFIYFFYRHLKKAAGKALGKCWISVYPKKILHFALVIIAFTLSVFCFSPDTLFEPLEKLANIEKPGLFKHKGLDLFSAGDWIHVSPEIGPSFSAFFPQAPLFKEEVHPVPRSDLKLTYREYMHVGNLDYRIGYTELPSSWTKWGSSLVLKGAMNFLTGDGGKMIYKKRGSHSSFPSMEYQITIKEKTILGKLVLVGNTLYKIEVVQKQPSLSDSEKEEAQKFFLSFDPKKS